MQASPGRDLAVGLFVLAGILTLAFLSLQIGGVEFGRSDSLALTATFDDIGGLSVRSPVRIAGVKIGQVSQIELDDELRAKVTLEVDPIDLSIDSSAAIRTSGLLGDQFIAVELGAEEESLRSGEAFQFTTSALSIDKLVGQLVHSVGLDEGDE